MGFFMGTRPSYEAGKSRGRKWYLDTKGIDDLAVKLGSLGEKAASAIYDMLIEGSDVMIDGMKRGCAEYGHVRTGGLRDSIGRRGEPEIDDYSGRVVITFLGTNKQGTRYGEIAAYLNYGTHGEAGDNWIDNTTELVKPLAIDAMRNALNRHLSENT